MQYTPCLRGRWSVVTTENVLWLLAATPTPSITTPPPAATAFAYTALIWAGLALFLGAVGEVFVERLKGGIGRFIKACALLCYMAFLAILDQGLFHGLITKAGVAVVGAGATEHTRLGVVGATFGLVATILALWPGAHYIYVSGRGGFVWGLACGIAVLVLGTVGGGIPALNALLTQFYSLVGPQLG
jgi:hypothetical protein